MVREIFFKLEFSYAHFGTDGITADTVPIVWKAICHLEINGVKVMFVTADGDKFQQKILQNAYNYVYQFHTKLRMYMLQMGIGYTLWLIHPLNEDSMQLLVTLW